LRKRDSKTGEEDKRFDGRVKREKTKRLKIQDGRKDREVIRLREATNTVESGREARGENGMKITPERRTGQKPG